MQRKHIIPIGLLGWLAAWPLAAHGEERPVDAAVLKRENESLRKELTLLEEGTRQLQHDLDEARAALVQAKFQIDALEHRCKKLQDELLAGRNGKAAAYLLEDGKANADGRGKSRSSAAAQGKITALGKDPRLLQISIGSDAGVKEGQILEVFRLASGTQRSLYLGTLTLIRVDPRAAVGQFKSVPGLDSRPMVGDDVSSELVVK